jgi:hypothetical protein
MLSTQVSTVGLHLSWRVEECLKKAATLPQQEKKNSSVVQRSRVNIALCTVTLDPCGDLLFTSWGH